MSTNGNGRRVDPPCCRDLVELVTDYLEGALPGERRRQFEAHLLDCPGCEAYVGQMRQTVAMLGALGDERAAPHRRERLVAAFRGRRLS